MKPTATGLSATNSGNTTPESKVHNGVVIGSVVAGVSCVMLALTGLLLVLRRRRRLVVSKPTHELPEDHALAESDADAEKKHPKELWGDHAAVEIGRNSRYEDSLSSSEPVREAHTVRGVNPLIRIHYVP